MPRSAVTTDAFNRAALGADWAQLNTIAGGSVAITGSVKIGGVSEGNHAVARFVGAASSNFIDNQYGSLALVDVDFGVLGYAVGVIARASADTDGNRDYYFGIAHSNDTYSFGKVVNGSISTFSSGAQNWSAADRIEIEVEDDTIRVMRNSSTIATTTDTALTTGIPGVLCMGDSFVATGDDWIGGNIVDPSAALTGTAVSTISETDIVAGGKTIIATLTGDTYVPAVSTQLITHVTSVVQSSVAFTTSFTITLPSTAANDILLLEYCHRSTNAGGIFGTGGSGTSWTLKSTRTFGPASTFSQRLFYRRATGNHSSQSIAVSSLIDSCAAMVTVYRGAITSGDPLASAAVVAEWNTAGNEVQAGISTNIAGTMVVLTVANSPDLALSNQSSINIGPLTERAEILNTGGTDASIGHASAIWNGTGDTSTFSWAQTNASSGSMAYAITPLTTSPFDAARQAFIDGFDSAQSEATGWDAEVKAKAAVTEVVRTSDTVVTWTIGAQAAYDITAQETITGTIPGSILISGNPIVATPTFTIDPGGAAAAAIRILFPYDLESLSGGVFGGRRVH